MHFYQVVRAISGACGSTGWVTSVLGVHPWQLGLFDDRAQAEVWGSDPDTLVSSAYAPVGRLEGGVPRRLLLVGGGGEMKRRTSGVLRRVQSAGASHS